MSFRRKSLLIFTPLLLACGPWFYLSPPPLASYPQRFPGKPWKEIDQDAHPDDEDDLDDPEADSSNSAESIHKDCLTLIADFPGLDVPARLSRIDEMIARNREGQFRASTAGFLLELRELASLLDDAGKMEKAKPYFDLRCRLFEVEWKAPWILAPGFWRDYSADDGGNNFRIALRQIDTAMGELKDLPDELLPYVRTHQASYRFIWDDYPGAIAGFREIISTAGKDHPRAEVAAFMIGRCLLCQSRDNKDPALLDQAEAAFQDYLKQCPDGRFVPDAHGWLGGIATDRHQYGAAIDHQLDRFATRPSRETQRSVLRECSALIPAWFAQVSKQKDQPAIDPVVQAETIPWEKLAGNPELCRLLVSLALDPTTWDSLPGMEYDSSSDRALIHILEERIIAPKPLAREALQRLGAAMLKRLQPPEADPTATGHRRTRHREVLPDRTTLLVLGVAALHQDRPKQALELFSQAQETGGDTDDLLVFRAHSLTALGRHREATAAYALMQREFPESSLASSTAFEYAISRARSGDGGEALLMLLEIEPAARTRFWKADSGTLPGALPEHEILQWMDTIAQFSPVEELAAPLHRLDPDSDNAKALRVIVRGRYLAAEKFDPAAQYLDLPASPAPNEPEDGVSKEEYDEEEPKIPGGYTLAGDTKNPLPLDGLNMTRERWEGDPSLLSREVAPKDYPMLLARADLWKSMRGQITLPLQSTFDFAESEPEKIDQIRLQNAALLGISPEAAKAELDSRDELQHALTCYLAAAESTDPDVAAPALEGANESLFHLAGFSLYRLDRAVEENHTALSARLVERLKKEFPTRDEALRAVPYTFTPLGPEEIWMPGDYNFDHSAEEMVHAINSGSASLEYARDYQTEELTDMVGDNRILRELPNGEAIIREQEELARQAQEPEKEKAQLDFHRLDFVPATQPGLDMDAIRAAVRTVREDFDKLRPNLEGPDILDHADYIDDFSTLADQPWITPDLFRGYASANIPSGLSEQATQGIQAYVDYRRIRQVVVDEYPAASSGDEDDLTAYLVKYPNGPKSENARLRLLRLRTYAVRPVPSISREEFPKAPIPTDYKHLSRLRPFTEEDMKSVEDPNRHVPSPDQLQGKERTERLATLLELDAFVKLDEQRYGKSRLHADRLMLSAAISSDIGDYTSALRDLTEVIEDPMHPELKMNASLYFAEIGQRLLDLNQRPAVAAAFRANPEAMKLLTNLIQGDTCLFRLRAMLPWLIQSGS